MYQSDNPCFSHKGVWKSKVDKLFTKLTGFWVSRCAGKSLGLERLFWLVDRCLHLEGSCWVVSAGYFLLYMGCHLRCHIGDGYQRTILGTQNSPCACALTNWWISNAVSEADFACFVSNILHNVIINFYLLIQSDICCKMCLKKQIWDIILCGTGKWEKGFQTESELNWSIWLCGHCLENHSKCDFCW